MPDAVLLPDGTVAVVNGGTIGIAGGGPGTANTAILGARCSMQLPDGAHSLTSSVQPMPSASGVAETLQHAISTAKLDWSVLHPKLAAAKPAAAGIARPPPLLITLLSVCRPCVWLPACAIVQSCSSSGQPLVSRAG